MTDIKVSIILPVYNEEQALEGVLQDVLRQEIPNCEIIVIDDGSTDRSLRIAQSFIQYGIRVVPHYIHSGMGATLLTGAIQSSGEYVVWMDADGQHRGVDTKKIIEEVRKSHGELDYIIGVRDKKSHRVKNRILGKTILRKIVEYYAHTSLPDFNSGLRVFRKNLLLSFSHMYPRGFSTSTVTSILMARLQEYKGITMPFTMLPRQGKSSVCQIKDGIKAIWYSKKTDAYINKRKRAH